MKTHDGRRERPARLLGAWKVVRVLAGFNNAADRRPSALARRADQLPPAFDLPTQNRTYEDMGAIERQTRRAGTHGKKEGGA